MDVWTGRVVLEYALIQGTTFKATRSICFGADRPNLYQGVGYLGVLPGSGDRPALLSGY